SVNRTNSQSFDRLKRLLLQRRSEVDQIVHADTLPVERWRLCRERLGWRSPLGLDIGLFYGTLFDRPDRLPRDSIEDVCKGLLRKLDHRADGLSVDIDIQQDRMRRHVIVPDVMVHQLVMPDFLSGF